MIFGGVFATLTMGLHPVGGGYSDIIDQAISIKLVHGLGMLCLPFLLFGCYGLMWRLRDEKSISFLAFILMSLGFLFAGIAALYNGFILPIFLENNELLIEQKSPLLRLIVDFSFQVNKVFDYACVAFIVLGISVYSCIVFHENKMPRSLGYLGVLILVLSVFGGLVQFSFSSLLGFRVFIFSIATWVIYAGVILGFQKEI